MKKIALLLILLLTVMSFVACGDTEPEKEGTDSFIGASGGYLPNNSTNSSTDGNTSSNNGTSQESSGFATSTDGTTSEQEYGNEVEIEAGDWADLWG